MNEQLFDVAIVGAGIAGASLAFELTARAHVLLLEREAHPGLHSTGRSAAMFMQSYGPPQVRALTRAGLAFYAQPPVGFADTPLLAARGCLYAGWRAHLAALDALFDELRSTGVAVERLSAAQTLARVPLLRGHDLVGAIAEPDAMDIDVHALHQGYLRALRRAGGSLLCDAEVTTAQPTAPQGPWQIGLADGRTLRARTLVNAAGAWADELARRCGVAPLGLQPKRRSAFTFVPPPGVDVRAWPAVCSVDESWYFKPDAGQLLGSPANADPVPPHDVVAEELDIATGIARIEAATTLTIRRPGRTWAGLRTFAPDGELVIGWDPRRTGFFWLAGQGGYGIQSAAGAAQLAAALWLGTPLPETLVRQGVAPRALDPARFASS